MTSVADNYRDSGMFASGVCDYSTTLGIDLTTTKADRIAYRDTTPNHAMVLLAVDTTENGVPRKWKVENSWGAATAAAVTGRCTTPGSKTTYCWS